MDRLNEITRECFTAVAQLRRIDPAAPPSPELLHQQLARAVDAVMRRAAEAGYAREDAQDIAYALVALIDEAALATPGPVRQHWMSRPLQLQFFNENTAGDGFYARLEAVRGNPARVDVLRVYFLCLAFGFLGRYGIRGGETDLAAIFQAVEQDLARAGALGGSEVLAPQGERPREPRAAARRVVPLVGIAAVALVAALGVYVALRVQLAQRVPPVVHALEAQTPR